MPAIPAKGHEVVKVLNEPPTILGANRTLAWIGIFIGVVAYNVTHQFRLSFVMWFFLHVAFVFIHKDDDRLPVAIYRALFWRRRYDASKRVPFVLMEDEEPDTERPPQGFF